MIRVHVWNFRGLTTAMGHASMHVGTEYISWWPNSSDDPRSPDYRNPKIPGAVGRKAPLYSVRHIHGQSFENDKSYESVDGVTPLAPDHTVMLDGLDEERILAWWRKFNVPSRDWSTFGQNCATTVGRGLMAGGADDYSLGASGWWHSWNTVWQPNDVLRFAQEVHHGLVGKRGHHAAINFVRRFCTSPLGFTSITTKMDEKGLAAAIYRELGGNTSLIGGVFQELDARRNTDADDVAEIYVNLLRTSKGEPLAAVAKDPQLKKLLIKILDEGWTSDGEKKCVDFLKSLT